MNHIDELKRENLCLGQAVDYLRRQLAEAEETIVVLKSGNAELLRQLIAAKGQIFGGLENDWPEGKTE